MRTMVTAGDRYERLLLSDAAFSVITRHRGMADVPRLEPDLLIASARDAAALADGMMVSPPRVLAVLEGEICPIDADASVGSGCSDEAFLDAARKAASALTPALAGKTASARRQAIKTLLDRLNMPCSLSGRRYLARAAELLIASPLLLSRMTTAVYPAVADEFHLSRFAVERAMRTAVEHVWLRGSMEAISLLFGMTVDPERGKPTNSEFLSLLAAHARDQLLRENSNTGCLARDGMATISATASPSARIPR